MHGKIWISFLVSLAFLGCSIGGMDTGISGGNSQGRVFGIYTQVYPLTFLYDTDFANGNYGGKLGTWGTSVLFADDIVDIPPVAGCQKSLSFFITNAAGGIYWLFCSNQTGTYAPVDVDLSSYAGGSLHFWIKATNDILFKLESSNQTKAAFRWLSGYAPINSVPSWQEINIPLSDFSPAPDFAKMNVIMGLHEGYGSYKAAEIYFSDRAAPSSGYVYPDTYNPGTGWVLSWSDEFNGTELDTAANWVYDLGGGGWGNSEAQTYTSNQNNIFVKDGKLTIRAVNSNGNYTSARIKTLGKQCFKYGKIVARMKLPSGRGMFPAFWMMGTNLPDAGWPACGEIDILEMGGGGDGDFKAFGTIHGGADPAHHFQFPFQRPTNTMMPFALGGNYHVYELEWTYDHVRMSVDGIVYNDGTGHGITENTHFILINLAVGGNCGGTGWPGYPDSSTVFPQTLEVDWVRVYQRDPIRPQIYLTYPATNAVIYGTFQCGGTALATNGFSNVMLSVDGGAFSPVTGSNTWKTNLTLSTGLHTIRAFALDVSNVTSWTDTLPVTVTSTPPAFSLTYIPPVGTGASVRGKLENVSPSEYGVVIYIHYGMYGGQNGWYVKPSLSSWYSPIGADGTWSVSYATSGGDPYSDTIVAFLVPKSCYMDSGGSYPWYADLSAPRGCVTTVHTHREHTNAPSITFSGGYDGSSCSLAGTSQDNWRIQYVYFSLNSTNAFTNVPGSQAEFWNPACGPLTSTNSENWGTNITLVPSTNVIRVYALDFNGNSSPTNEWTIVVE